MSEMLDYKSCQALDESKKTPTGNLATVAAVYPDGIVLMLAGETEPGSKRYPYNAACSFEVGQRVHIARESGTIIVEYPIGGSVNAAKV